MPGWLGPICPTNLVLRIGLFLLLIKAALPLKAPETYRLGFWCRDVPSPVSYCPGNGRWFGFEALLANELAHAAAISFELVQLHSLEDRIPGLLEGSVDVTIGSLSVDPEVRKEVTPIFPAYYTAGTALFAPGGSIPGVQEWGDLSGKKLAILAGDQAYDDIAAYGVVLVQVPNLADAAELVRSGEVVALVDDSIAEHIDNITLVTAPVPILALPQSVAVGKNNTALAEKLSKAMLELMSAGQSSTIIRIERETLGAAGVPPNTVLEAFVNDPSVPSVLKEPGLQAGGDSFKVGVWYPLEGFAPGESPAFEDPWKNGSYVGFEPMLLAELAKLAGMAVEMIHILSFDQPIPALADDVIDFYIGSFSVSQDRMKLVNFARPGYYSAGAALFAPGGRIDGVKDWPDLKGKVVATWEGYYATGTLIGYGAKILTVKTLRDAADLVHGGKAVAFVDDSVYLHYSLNLSYVNSPAPIARQPYAIAVKKGNFELLERISRALLRLVSGGENAAVMRIEKETFVTAGLPPNPDLQALVKDPMGDTLLNGFGF